MSVVDGPEHRALALQAARESLVLLKNDGLLPFDARKTKKLAVIGPAANVFLHGSAGYHGTNGHLVTPREGILRRAGSTTTVSFAAGTVMPSGEGFSMAAVPESLLRAPDGQPGLRCDYFSNRTLSGAPALSRIDAKLDFAWGNGSPATGLPSDDFSVRWTGKLVPKTSGSYVLSVTGDDGYRLSLDGKVIVEDWTDHGSRARGTVTPLEKGRSYDLTLEFYEHGGGADLQLSYAFVQDGVADAVKAAREADAVVFFAAVDITNTGARPGVEVAEVYVHPPRGPKRVLRAFRRVTLGAGEKMHVSIDLAVADLAHYDVASKRSVVDPGRYELLIGASSADIRQKSTFDVVPP